MTIGQLARRVGVRPSAIRYYEAHGVLCPPVRSANTYRLYGAEAITLLRFVRRAKELGFSLHEVRQLIGASRDEPPCTLCRQVIARHLTQVEGELDRLRSLQDRLRRLLRSPLPEAAGGICPLIEGDRIQTNAIPKSGCA
ncbi:MAG TPA: MerR family transcriptional regulator [Acetobacteraceae bacterium]|nr:MerR family transcriptional regulator [Acetobacteraceae bacterium]